MWYNIITVKGTPQTEKERKKMFEVGKTYTARCFGDHELVENWTVISRTAKTMKIREPYEGEKKVKIYVSQDGEYAKTFAGFSYLRA